MPGCIGKVGAFRSNAFSSRLFIGADKMHTSCMQRISVTIQVAYYEYLGVKSGSVFLVSIEPIAALVWFAVNAAVNKTLIISHPETLDADTTVPAKTHLLFLKGGSIVHLEPPYGSILGGDISIDLMTEREMNLLHAPEKSGSVRNVSLHLFDKQKIYAPHIEFSGNIIRTSQTISQAEESIHFSDGLLS